VRLSPGAIIAGNAHGLLFRLQRLRTHVAIGCLRHLGRPMRRD